ncbi:ATP-binding protein [Streptomyces phaeofaciens]|nr:ATP-binding protein [Streptomyces phaeofaciens]
MHPVSATVCLVPLEEAETTPRYQWTTTLLADSAAGRNARLRVRPRLTAARWRGPIDVAAQITDRLVDNAVRYGKPFGDGRIGLRLTVLPRSDELLVEVDDAEPGFPAFDTVAASPPAGRGLWWVMANRAGLSWAQKHDNDGQVVGKTVSARVPVTWEGEHELHPAP